MEYITRDIRLYVFWHLKKGLSNGGLIFRGIEMVFLFFKYSSKMGESGLLLLLT